MLTNRMLFSMVMINLIFLWAVPSSLADEVFTTKDGPVRVNNWGYQLQGTSGYGGELRPQFIAAAAHDLIVVDYSRFGDEASKFTPAEVTRMQNSDPTWGGNGRRKIVVAYLSIGEISDFRSFWDPKWTTNGKATGENTIFAPPWLGPINPDWPEGRKVRYWDPDWQSIIFNNLQTGWLDQIIAQGFDGMYLDIVDAYYYWFQEGERTELQAAQAMIDFISALNAHAQLTNPQFLTIPQNAEAILDVVKNADPSRYTTYLDAINAIGSEDVYFFGDRARNNRFNPQHFVIGVLKRDFLANGIPVFVLDYVNQANKISQLFAETLADGFYPYPAPNRGLSRLATPGPGIPAMTLTANQLQGGEVSTFTLQNGDANVISYLVYSTNAETGATYSNALDLAIFMLNPKLVAAPKTTAADGTAQWLVRIPLDATGKHVRLQGLQFDRATNVIAATIQ